MTALTHLFLALDSRHITLHTNTSVLVCVTAVLTARKLKVEYQKLISVPVYGPVRLSFPVVVLFCCAVVCGMGHGGVLYKGFKGHLRS